MKHKGSCFEYEKERNEDLMQNYRSILLSSSKIVSPDVFCQLVNRPSKRFWVSEERTAIVLARMIKGDTLDSMRSNTREMFYEIFRRAKIFMETHEYMSLEQVSYHVIRQKAPKFYLTPATAYAIIRKYKKQFFKKHSRHRP